MILIRFVVCFTGFLNLGQYLKWHKLIATWHVDWVLSHAFQPGNWIFTLSSEVSRPDNWRKLVFLFLFKVAMAKNLVPMFAIRSRRTRLMGTIQETHVGLSALVFKMVWQSCLHRSLCTNTVHKFCSMCCAIGWQSYNIHFRITTTRRTRGKTPKPCHRWLSSPSRAKVLSSQTPGSTRPKLTKSYFDDLKSSIEKLILDCELLAVDT